MRITRTWYDEADGVWCEQEVDPCDFFVEPPRTAWIPPTVRRFTAGDAEQPDEVHSP